MPVEIVNRQRRYAVDVVRVAAVADGVLGAVRHGDSEISVTLSNDRTLRALNRAYRGKDRATDVLSFVYGDADGPLGDVIISIDRALAQATERGHALQREVELLTLHGTLHVCGYDHETDDGQMNRIERRLRSRLVVES